MKKKKNVKKIIYWAIFRNAYLANYLSDFLNLVCKVVCIESVKYVNLIEIGPVVRVNHEVLKTVT